MRKISFVLVILFIIGCTSNKKEEKSNIKPESTTAIDTAMVDHTSEQIISNEEKIEVKDSVIVTNKVKESETDIKVSKGREIAKEAKAGDKKEKKEITKGNIERIRPHHTIWNSLTKKHVSSSGKVNYNGFKSNIKSIEIYLSHLEVTPPKKDWTKNEKLAYWFNLYNAATIHLIASNYPVKSIKDINNGKPWDKKFIKSGNKTYSLNQIENSIVRPNFNEPRLHVAFNCAAISCPKLMKGAFLPSKLNSQLNMLSKSWITDSSKNKISENSIEISKIFEWYKVDFKKGIIPFINNFSTTKITPNAEIKYLDYNWDLND
ncbi:DUF547 domain-containing protein [Aquimarina latercula]|uniref:DUF547 domain-containing protein n=1 Tax=Aquimarina latercula TaxID=987 RepID=UPI00040DFE2F|nr:DUF547 domain-containing protein [Aquimarina latercula]